MFLLNTDFTDDTDRLRQIREFRVLLLFRPELNPFPLIFAHLAHVVNVVRVGNVPIRRLKELLQPLVLEHMAAISERKVLHDAFIFLGQAKIFVFKGP